jgi:hypothetical protein
MSATLLPQPIQPSQPLPDQWLRRGKEGITALIALAIIVSLIVMLVQAFPYVSVDDKTDQSFQHIKDLLLFVNPLVGVVIGYYFNKVSTEARAENAEATATAANTNTQQAVKERAAAEEREKSKSAEAEEAKTVLKTLVPAAKSLLEESSSPPSSQGGAVSDEAPQADMRARLQYALERAERILS